MENEKKLTIKKDKKLKKIYANLCSYENLELAFKRARKGKSSKKYVIEFEEDLKKNLLKLKIELLMHTYKPLPLKTFILRDPKTRKISKSAFRDRIVHHAICNLIESIFDERFIYDSYANRLGKGSLNAITRFEQFTRKVSQNNTIRCYVLKADIRQYFETVNHQILIKLLKRKVKDESVLWLIEIILANYKTKSKGKGMPLGNLTSQFFANVYLNELDQFVKHKLRVKYYIRYVDDFVILHKSKKVLEVCMKEINGFLRKKLDLTLHYEKSQILKLKKGIGFLGFRIFYHHKLVRKKNRRKFERKLETMKVLYKKKKIEREKVIEKFEGWLAYASHANSYKYRRRITSEFNQHFPLQPVTIIHSVKKHEIFNRKIDTSKVEFSSQKTLLFFRKGLTLKKIAIQRGIKEATVWEHLTKLIEYHQIKLKEILPIWKIQKVIKAIKSPQDKLKEIKDRLHDSNIRYCEISCVLAVVKGKHKKKSITYFIDWYQRTNCFRKCYFNKLLRNTCRVKFQQFTTKDMEVKFTKNEFLNLFNNYVNICELPENEKKRFMSWQEFQMRNKKSFNN